MKRITPEEVKAAYEATGLKPIRYGWYRHGCGCGLTAYAVANELVSINELEDIGEQEDDESTVCNQLLNLLESRYISGFTDGFDSVEWDRVLMPYERELYAAGKQDGRAAAALVFGDTHA